MHLQRSKVRMRTSALRKLDLVLGCFHSALDVPITSEAELAFVDAFAAAAPDILATVPAADQPTLGRIRAALHLGT